MSLDDIFDEANALWGRGEVADAFNLFYEAANQGHGSAQHNVGFFYDSGIFVSKNSLFAVLWYLRAFETDGQTSSCSNIAKICSENGDFSNAVYWWSVAVRSGDGDAALELAQYLMLHRDIKSDLDVKTLLEYAVGSVNITESGRGLAASILDSLPGRGTDISSSL